MSQYFINYNVISSKAKSLSWLAVCDCMSFMVTNAAFQSCHAFARVSQWCFALQLGNSHLHKWESGGVFFSISICTTYKSCRFMGTIAYDKNRIYNKPRVP